MKIAFVGFRKDWANLEKRGYVPSFVRYHLELPWYYARDGKNDVDVYTDDPCEANYGESFVDGSIHLWDGGDFRPGEHDVVVHWRKWFEKFRDPDAVNLLNCQDHSFSREWLSDVRRTILKKELRGILCFPTWHRNNLIDEICLDDRHIFAGVTLGVDTDVYHPCDKDPYAMLWAADPGRGIQGTIRLALEMFRIDSRYRLHVCYPDYSPPPPVVKHPAIVWHGNVDNGSSLRKLFNETGILPYTSEFMEPSSRAHRQAMAAGSLVLYPPGKGSPSELIQNDLTGIVSDPGRWSALIDRLVRTGEWKEIGDRARGYAISENWAVQSSRFNDLCEYFLSEEG